jgi:hypothetical protein
MFDHFYFKTISLQVDRRPAIIVAAIQRRVYVIATADNQSLQAIVAVLLIT